ncbi:MAG: DUF6790 family protein [Gammaproteobacteria bacterium]|nr:DUF6790 family protein [Gammaproteobacteria bacterium]
MNNIIALALKNSTLTLLIFGLIASLLSLIPKKPITKAVVTEALLRYFLIFSIGLSFLYNFIMHCIFGDYTAAFIGWAQSPFQFEVGMVSLGISITGFIAFRANYSFRAATIIPPVVFLWGAAGGHIYQMVMQHNFAPGNAGTVFWTDVFIPIIALVLLRFSKTS